jgi:hypothetical protein
MWGQLSNPWDNPSHPSKEGAKRRWEPVDWKYGWFIEKLNPCSLQSELINRRPYQNRGRHRVRDSWLVTCDLWLVTCDLWLVTCDLWLVTCDLWLVTLDFGEARWDEAMVLRIACEQSADQCSSCWSTSLDGFIRRYVRWLPLPGSFFCLCLCLVYFVSDARHDYSAEKPVSHLFVSSSCE